MLAALLLSALPLVPPQAEDEATGRATVYKVDRVETLAGKSVENATLVVRDGILERVGQAVITPDHAKVVDLRGTGSVAMPPFVLGMSGVFPSEPRGTSDNARYVAAESYFPDEEVFEALREQGVLLLQLDPPGSGIPGRTSVIRTDHEDFRTGPLVRDLHLKMTVSMSKRAKDMLRKALKDADAAIDKEEKARAEWKKARADWEAKQKAEAEKAKKEGGDGKGDGGGKAAQQEGNGQNGKDDKEPPKEFEPPKIPDDLQPVVDWVRKERVVQVWMGEAGDWLHWLDVLDDRELPWEAVLSHRNSTNLHEIAERIAQSGVRVYVPAEIAYLPSTRLRINLPAELHRAGVEKMVLLPAASGSVQGLETWRVGLSDIVREGLDAEAALRAVTLEPAAAMGQEELVKPLEAGAPATFIILDGDPLDPLSRVTHLVAEGEVVYDRAEAEDEE